MRKLLIATALCALAAPAWGAPAIPEKCERHGCVMVCYPITSPAPVLVPDRQAACTYVRMGGGNVRICWPHAPEEEQPKLEQQAGPRSCRPIGGYLFFCRA